MPWPRLREEDGAFFREHGFVAVHDAIPTADIDELTSRCACLEREPHLSMAGTERAPDGSEYQVSQSMLEMVWLDWRSAPFHRWTLATAAALLEDDVSLWYNQLLHKPARVGAPTFWHQDEALFHPGLVWPRMISCWMPLADVDTTGGCMHFRDAAGREVAVPLQKGGLTFHRGTTLHMSLPNTSATPRQVVIQRFTAGPPPTFRMGEPPPDSA